MHGLQPMYDQQRGQNGQMNPNNLNNGQPHQPMIHRMMNQSQVDSRMPMPNAGPIGQMQGGLPMRPN